MATTWVSEIRYPADRTDYWSRQSKVLGTVEHVVDPATLNGDAVSLVWTRAVPTGLREDRMVTTIHLAKEAISGSMSALGSTEMAAVETALDTLWTTIKAYVATTVTLVEYRWHQFGATITKPGPAVRVTARSAAGTGGGNRAPDQVALTQTLVTASRKHWGRNYWPGWTVGQIDVNGRATTSALSNLRDGFAAFMRTQEAAAIPVVVWSQTYRSVLLVRELHVDDTFDIQRRRRAKQPQTVSKITS